MDDLIAIQSILCASSAGALFLCAAKERMKKQRKRRQWVKLWKQKRETRGSYHLLTQELRLQDKEAYRSYLRMDEECFKEILNLIKDDISKQDTFFRNAIPAEEKLSVALRFLATGESFRSLEFQTRLSLALISNTVPQVCYLIYKKLKDKYIKFPSTHEEWREIANQFSQRWQFPLCIGALDGKHVGFRALKRDGALYYKYKGFHSIVLLAMCDANYKFTFVDIGSNGRMSDGGILNKSDLRQFLLQSNQYLPPNEKIGNDRILPYVIVGDDAFPLETHLMKPYPYRTTDREKQIFNYRLSHARQTIEHSFGILSNRFRVLQTTIYLHPTKVKIIIQAACALHNMLIAKNDNYIDPIQLNTNKIMEDHTKKRDQNPRNHSKFASGVRNEFADYFMKEGAIPWQEAYI